MSYTAHHKNLAAYVGDPPRRNVAVNGVGILRRPLALFSTLWRSRVRSRPNEKLLTSSLRGADGSPMILSVRCRLLTSDWSPRER